MRFIRVLVSIYYIFSVSYCHAPYLVPFYIKKAIFYNSVSVLNIHQCDTYHLNFTAAILGILEKVSR